jgi:hypothetical protein
MQENQRKLAGRRKRLVLEERQDDEKVIHPNSLLMAETANSS